MKPQFCGQNGPERNCASPDTDGRMRELRVEQQAGQRLDHALEALLPHLGVRGRKRCIESGLVLVNGRPAAASRRMRQGDVICLLDATTQIATAPPTQAAPGAATASTTGAATASLAQVAPEGDLTFAPGADLTSAREAALAAATGGGAASALQTATAPSPEHAPALFSAAQHRDPCAQAAALGLRLLDRQGEYCFFSKPANMHSAALAGSTQASVEALAPALAAAWDGPSTCQTSGQTSGHTSGQAYPPAMSGVRKGCGQPLQCQTQGQPVQSQAQGQPLQSHAQGTPQGQPVHGATQGQELMLLQRLDFGTSGLLCAALTPAAAAAFRAAEAKGHCEKRYVALLTGVLTGPITARQSLGVSGRRKSRLRDAQADKTRWTDFWPLHVWHPDAMDAEELRLLFGVSHDTAVPLSFPPQGLTLAACRIRRGARHQIRVHAAGLGHALWGDALYADGESALPQDSGGVEASTELHGFFLHHGGLRLPGAACVDYPPWPLPEALGRLVRAWFEGVLPQAGR